MNPPPFADLGAAAPGPTPRLFDKNAGMTPELEIIRSKILVGERLTEPEIEAWDKHRRELDGMPPRRSLTPEEQASFEAAWNDEEGIARWAKWLDEQPEEFRQMIDEIGTSSRRRVTP